jgi:ankyrin repeat protein
VGTSHSMGERAAPRVEVVDVAPGLWIWRLEHPGWRPEVDWQKVVTSVCVNAGSERWIVDPLLPVADATEVWARLAARRPTAVAILLPDHVREIADDRSTWSVDVLVERYGAKAFGPSVFDPPQIPTTTLTKIEPGRELPGGVTPFRDPRGWNETPLWFPEQRTIVFGDTLTERRGALRVWMSPTHTERALPDLRAMLELPVERVIISHGSPVHDRAEFARALERPPWPASELHLVAYRGNLDRVRRLVEAGADLGARDELHDETPLGWARSGKHQDVIDYLEAHQKRR